MWQKVILFVFLAGIALPALGESDAWRQSSNNNRIIQNQKADLDTASEEPLRIDFYGHAAFRLTSPAGLSILFDPWRNDPSGAWGLWFPENFPAIQVDAVFSTHAHFDHDAVYRPEAPMVLDRMAGKWSLGDVNVHGLADKHVCISPGTHSWHEAFEEFGVEGCPPNNPGHMDNVIFLVDAGGIRIVIWGDNRANPADHVWGALTDVDVLILPIDQSQHLLSYAESDAIVARLQPRIVIPSHYLTSGVSSVLSTLGSADEWVNQHSAAVHLNEPTLLIDKSFLKDKSGQIYYFGNTHKSK